MSYSNSEEDSRIAGDILDLIGREEIARFELSCKIYSFLTPIFQENNIAIPKDEDWKDNKLARNIFKEIVLFIEEKTMDEDQAKEIKSEVLKGTLEEINKRPSAMSLELQRTIGITKDTVDYTMQADVFAIKEKQCEIQEKEAEILVIQAQIAKLRNDIDAFTHRIEFNKPRAKILATHLEEAKLVRY